jgi:enoyl-CoA hydratase/carnithine racemase
LTINVPSLCVFNGHAIAGGFLLGLAHDKIIMNGDQKLNFRCHLNELDNGVAIPLGMTKFVEGTTSGTIARQLIMGNPYNCKEA